MKKLINFICAGTLLLASQLLAAGSFEGKVNFALTSGKDKPMAMNYSIKGDKLRIDMPDQKDMGGMIMDMAKKEMIMIMKKDRMYMVMPMPEAAVEQAKKQSEDAKFEKTSETEKILGYTATKYLVTDKKGTTTDLWLAEGLGNFMAMGDNPMGGGRNGGEKAWQKLLAGKDLFPLRVVGKDKGGKESFRMEVTAIEKKSLPDSDFAAPAGFEKFDMGGMGGMMKGLVPGIGK
jgi:hypothetical protein